jgi:hypothetical protein
MKAAIAALVCVLAASPAFAQQPRTVNARVSARQAGADLSGAIAAIVTQQVEPAWLGYGVPIFNRDGSGGQDGWSERCRLEQTAVDGTTPSAVVPAGPIRLEPSPTVMVLVRIQNREVLRIRALSTDCAIDAGGLVLYWIDNVNAAQSVAYLKTIASNVNVRGQSDPALTALSLHRDPAAASALLDLARNHSDGRVRQRALVSVARRAESQAIPAISDAIERDPDNNVKKQAVFALSQLPRGEGTPLLITLARSSANPVVKKQAMFWLGQSRDPRALAYFEQILR